MQFNSILFIFCFLPIFLCAYYAVSESLRSLVMVVGSLILYGSVCKRQFLSLTLLIIFTILVFRAGMTLSGKWKKTLLTLYLTAGAAVMAFFKIYRKGSFFPVGMSFYLFQMAAYLIEVYRINLIAEKKFIPFAAQILMFPKLLSGPLMSPVLLQDQHRKIVAPWRGIHDGLQKFILGLFLKVLISNRVGGLWAHAAVIGYESISVPGAWMAVLAYSIQLYFDFWGYSLMALGLGEMLGYHLPENFRDPYAAGSVSDFYRRWHVTLGLWFREYVYFPLGGSRKGPWHTVFNLAVVWIFTGLWHGNGGNYLLWAGILCVLIVSEHLWIGKYLKKTKILCHVYTVFLILLSWVPFAVGNWYQMLSLFGRMFGLSGKTLNPRDIFQWGREYGMIMLVGLVLMTPWPGRLWKRISQSIAADVLLLVLFWIAVYFIATASQDPFLYFQF